MALLALRRRWVLVTIAAIVIAGLAAATFFWFRPGGSLGTEPVSTAKPEAPPDLQKLREAYAAGVAAVQRSDGPAAVKQLSSFTFGPRAVEEYRLYYLANGYRMSGDPATARATLARLWHRSPKMVYADEVGFALAGMHSAAGDWNDAAAVYAGVATRAVMPEVSATARWEELESRLASGDVAGALGAAKLIVTRSPRSPQAGDSIALIRSLASLPAGAPIPLTAGERLERAVSLLRDGSPQNGLAELTALEPDAPASLRLPIQLNRGLALHQMRRYEESSKVLEPLTDGYYKYAIPALYHASKNYRALAASIDPTTTKVVKEKKQVGTVKVKVKTGKGKKAKTRTVAKPKFANVNRTVKLVDLAKKSRKEEYERLGTERLKDLLLLPLSAPVRLEVLNTLIEIASAKDQDDYVQELVSAAVKVDPLADPGLQELWDKGWAAYARGDLPAARRRFRYISDTYTNPNVKRQNEYWFARTIERQGEKEQAAAIYQRLASAPYADLYAIHSAAHGAKRQEDRSNPVEAKREDWAEIAEREMPSELRLAYELTALTDMRDARVEIQRNMRPENTRYAEAILADIYNSAGNALLMYRSIRRAFPQLATAEQDTAPPYFIRMYYPVKYQEPILKYSQRVGVDPYLVMGLILQESYYNPTARSRVGATGLMQIMPPTGKELAQRLRIPFGASRLENPEVNVQLGTLHLKGLIDMFGGNPYLAVASYNAGQGNVLKWRRANPSRPLDEFLESIPFSETRNYVKRVTMLRSAYARIAG